MTENMKIALEAINKWFYFTLNYEIVLHNWEGVRGEQFSQHLPKFLVEAKWTCNLDHMVEKWEMAVRSGNAHDYLTRFYAELDCNNRIALLEWVVANYNGEKKIF